MQFDHSKLLGRIVEKYGSQSAFAMAINWTESKVSSRLSNRTQLDAGEIILWAKALDIPTEEIAVYFFAV